MVANSLLAYASVNHLHYHFLYISHNLPAAKVVSSQKDQQTNTCIYVINFCIIRLLFLDWTTPYQNML